MCRDLKKEVDDAPIQCYHVRVMIKIPPLYRVHHDIKTIDRVVTSKKEAKLFLSEVATTYNLAYDFTCSDKETPSLYCDENGTPLEKLEFTINEVDTSTIQKEDLKDYIRTTNERLS